MDAELTLFDCKYYVREDAAARRCRMLVQGTELILYFSDPEGGMLMWSCNAMAEPQWQDGSLLLRLDRQLLEIRGAEATTLMALLKVPAMNVNKNKFKNSHLALIALAGLLITGLAFYLFFAFLPALAGKAAAFVPPELEVKLGEQLAEVYRLQDADVVFDSVDHYLTQFTSQLKLNTDYPLKVRLIHSEEINAFALPGGNIFIYSGLLSRMQSHEELVALLGHEISHVTKRHSLKSIMSGAAISLVLNSFFGDISGMSSWLMSKAGEFKQLGYSRELETEADLAGLELMAENEVDPQGMIRLLELLQKESGDTPELMKYLSSHPDTEARIKNVKLNGRFANNAATNKDLQVIFEKISEEMNQAVLVR